METLMFLLGFSLLAFYLTLLNTVFQPYSGHAWRQVRKIQMLGLPEDAKELAEQALFYRLVQPVYQLVKARVKLNSIDLLNWQTKLEQAGWPHQPEQFIAVKILVGIGILLVGLLLALLQQRLGGLHNWLLLAVAGYFLPDVLIRGKIVQRREQIMAEFPDFIDATRSYLSSGLSIYQTIKQVKDIAGPGLEPILEKLSAELEIYDQATALRKFALRTGLLEVQNFVVTIEQGISAGIPLKEIFLSQAQLMRELRKLSLKRKIKQKPTYMALVGGMLFINIFIIIGLPAMLTIMTMRGIGN